MSYATADFSGLRAGFDRRAENLRTQYKADSDYAGTVYNANTQAESSRYKVDTEDLRARELAKAENQLRWDISEEDRKNAKEVARIQGMYGVGSSALRTIPTVIPLFFNQKGGNSNGGNKSQGASPTASTQQAIPDTELFKKGTALNPRTIAKEHQFNTLVSTQFRPGNATLGGGSQDVYSQSITNTSIWNKLKDAVTNSLQKSKTGAVLTGLGTAAAIGTMLAL